MNFQVVLEPCDVGGFTAYVPALPGCMSEGETEEEALANVRDAIRLYLEPIDEAFTSAAQCVREIAL